MSNFSTNAHKLQGEGTTTSIDALARNDVLQVLSLQPCSVSASRWSATKRARRSPRSSTRSRPS